MPAPSHTWSVLLERTSDPGVGTRRRRHAEPDGSCAERAFGVLEVVVVMTIIAILLGAMVSTFRGSKRSAHFKLASAAAASYADGIEAYMADNGQVPPVLGGAEWPAATMKRGPVNLMLLQNGQPRPYLARSPEAVEDGIVGIGASPAGGAAVRAFITYSVSGAQYSLLVETTATGSDPVLRCVVTNAAQTPAGVQRC